MSATLVRSEFGRGVRRALALALLAVGLARPAAAAETLFVTLDQAAVIKLPEKVATVVVGNPLIADVTVQVGNIMVVTGKGHGVTNLVALDRQGAVLMDKSIAVRAPREGVIFVYKGVERESYNCTPKCDPRVTLGDSSKFFDAALNQTVTRSSQAAK